MIDALLAKLAEIADIEFAVVVMGYEIIEGKSTLIKIIAGVYAPDSGSVKVNGRIAPFLELGVGFNPELTAEDNVRLYGAIMGMSKSEMEDKFEEIFEFAELSRFRNMKLKNFSSGMYSRLAFATAVATDPDILQ
ncbi:MAG: ATP-binding cassette domain-containing protein [Candidatus Methanoperedens sp.]|nr:ATP-binding cassette domain-containing protein [Candidatus Methanoperedens sp.]